MNDVMTWREFCEADDGMVVVTTYETPIGKTTTIANSHRVSFQVVSREDAVLMLRHGTVKP